MPSPLHHVRGRIVDEHGKGHQGLRVRVVGARLLRPDAPLGEAVTDRDGRFDVALRPPARAPRLIVLDEAGLRPLLEIDPEEEDDVGTLVLPRADAEGLLATAHSGAPRWTSHGNEVDLLIDGEAAFGAVLDAVDRARRRLDVLQLLFKPDFRAAFPPPPRGRGGEEPQGRRLVDALRAALGRGVDVRILLNENLVLPDDVDEMQQALDGAAAPGRAIVRRFPMSPATMHAKVVLVDEEEAFVPGQPFEPRFWDSREHRMDDARRGRGIPIHDVSCRVRGPAVRDLAELFVELWNARGAAARGGDRLDPPRRSPPIPGGATLQVTLTSPPGIGAPDGLTTILESYQRALAAARRLVYVETQYFTSAVVAASLRRALDSRPELEAILVVNEHMDFPTYDVSQARRLAELGWPHEPRLGVYSAWAAGTRHGLPGVRPLYVHSKVAVVDDRWCTLGSANLDGISVEAARELGFPDDRAVEQNLSVLDAALARRLRCALWAELVGGAPEDHRERPPGGWIAAWEEAARRNAEALLAGKPMPRGHVLRHRARPRDVPMFDRSMNPFNVR